MKENLAIRRRGFLCFTLSCFLPSIAAADDYPTKPIQVVVPWAAGGVLDSVARWLQPSLANNLGQPIVIENRSGANGTVGTAFVARSKPDGYTILMTIESHVINQSLFHNLSYNAFEDFEPIALIGGGPLLLIANKKTPWNSVAQVVEAAKEKPGSVTYASIGAGSQHHLVGLLLAQHARIELTHVPYRGGGPAMVDLIAGNVPLMILSITGVLPLLQSDEIKVLAVFAPQRIPLLPSVPTIAEAGYPGIEAAVWFGSLVPRETPLPIRVKLLAAFRAAASGADVQEHFAKLGLQTTIRGPDEFQAIMKADFQKYDGVARTLNLDLN
jgi:tripartite-type tricarboxylate transporter receptor subunit TctC